MEYRVLYSAAAKRDIEIIYDYISDNLANPTSAKTIISQILIKCDSLSLFPEATPVKYKRRHREYRLLQLHHYVIIYIVDPANREVTIHRILSSRRDISSILADDR